LGAPAGLARERTRERERAEGWPTWRGALVQGASFSGLGGGEVRLGEGATLPGGRVRVSVTVGRATTPSTRGWGDAGNLGRYLRGRKSGWGLIGSG
jgi:hypothetical protein